MIIKKSMKKTKYILIISSSFILISLNIFAEVAGTTATAHVACMGMSQEDATSYAKSPLSSW